MSAYMKHVIKHVFWWYWKRQQWACDKCLLHSLCDTAPPKVRQVFRTRHHTFHRVVTQHSEPLPGNGTVLTHFSVEHNSKLLPENIQFWEFFCWVSLKYLTCFWLVFVKQPMERQRSFKSRDKEDSRCCAVVPRWFPLCVLRYICIFWYAWTIKTACIESTVFTDFSYSWFLTPINFRISRHI